MRMVINALSARRGGGQTYLLNLLQNLDRYDGEKMFVLAPDSLHLLKNPKIERIQVKWPIGNPLLRSVWERFLLPHLLRKIQADVLFCSGGLLNISSPKTYKTVVIFRNMIPFDPVQRRKYPFGWSRIRNWILEKAMMKSMLNADLVIFVSHFAKRVIENRIGKKLSNSVTIPHGLNDYFKIPENKATIRPHWLPEEGYLLYVSIFDVYKNQLEVVHGFHLLKQRRKTVEKLILVGRNSSQYGRKVRREIARLGLQNDVILTGSIMYEELPSVYYHAKMNIFASECENCPNILLEAMGAGRPVLASNRQSIPEFGGDAVIYFDPSSPEDIAEKIASIIDDDVRMKELSAKARERSLQYDWRKTARLTMNAIYNCMS